MKLVREYYTIKKMHFILIFVIIITILSVCNCVDPITITTSVVGAGISLGFAGYKLVNCVYNECCDKPWINYDHDGLRQDMRNYLFGQHLATFLILRSIKSHLKKENPPKALVLSFHGGTGTGKNHVSKMIMKSLYKKGSNSQFAHLYIGTQHFPHSQDVEEYRTKLQKEIEMKVKQCERSLFVFDEVDKMPLRVLDILRPYLDYHEKVDGVDYRKNIFIFLSNAGAQNISNTALRFFIEGKDRKDITLKDMEHLISKGAFNEAGGLQYSDIVKRDLIDVYVPFLPLEKKHVKECITSELQRRQLKGDVDEIANELQYGPPDVEFFSVNGCKKVAQKVDIFSD